jgi:hypothetical protein
MDFKISTDLWPERPSDSVPSIFRRRKILVGRSRKRGDHGGKVSKRIRAARHSNNGANNNPPVDNNSAVIVIDGETDEQRLPLKKRHHHLQRDATGGGGGNKQQQQHVDEIEIEIEIGGVSPVKTAPPATTATAVVNREKEVGGGLAGKASVSAVRSAEGVYRAAGKTADILSPSKMPPHRPFDQGRYRCLSRGSVLFKRLSACLVNVETTLDCLGDMSGKVR